MSGNGSGALVFLGATGDLAYKKIFPALQRMIRNGALDVPVIGVAKAGWDLARLKERARDSVEKHGGIDREAFEKLASLLRCVDGDTRIRRLSRRSAGSWAPRRARPITWPSRRSSSRWWWSSWPIRAAPGAPGWWWRSRSGGIGSRRGSSTASFCRSFPRRTFSASITTWARTRCRTWSFSGSPTPSWSRSGTGTTWIRSRSPWRRAFGVQGRGAFYEEAGAIRDVVQNHLLQVLTNLAMEPPPGSADNETFRDEKALVLKAIPPLSPDQVVRGQFRGYRSEPGVAPASGVETFAAVRLEINSWRWQGVPFYIRAGKCLPVTCTEVLVKLRQPPPLYGVRPAPNHLRFRLGPDLAIALGTMVKQSGEGLIGEAVELLASHQTDPDEADAYEQLLGDAMRGEAFRFAREDYVEEAWRIVDPALKSKTGIFDYEPGSWGPLEAKKLVAPGAWHNPSGSR